MDLITVLISYLITNAICAGVIWALYSQNRKHFNGLEFWLTAYLMQFVGLILVYMRAYLPELISVVAGNGIFIGGTILLYVGLERFLGKRSNQVYNFILLILFIAAHAYFLIVHPSMTARSINLSLMLVVLCAQFVWLIFHRADLKLRPIVREAGFIFAAYGIASFIRICVNLVMPLNEDFFQMNLFNTIVIVAYQMLFIALTFNLFLSVNRRLILELHDDLNERQRMGEAIKQSEQLYYQMFSEHSAVKLLIDPTTGAVVQANLSAAQFYGYTIEELQASNVAQINALPPDVINEAMQKALQRKTNYFIFQHRLASGEVRDVEVHSSPIKVSGRELLYSIIHDITERKQAESQREAALEKLRESEERLRLAVSAGRMGIWDRNFVTGQLNWSVECKAMFGLPPETEMNDERFMNALHPDDRLPIDIAIRESQAKQTDFNTEYRAIWPDGTQHWITALGHWYYDETGQAIRMAGATLDITERKQTEAALRESRETLALFINQSPIYAYIKEVTPTQSRVIYASENFVDMVGTPSSEMIGKTMEELFPADFAAKITADDWTVASGEGILNQEEELNGRQYTTIKFPLLRTGRANLLAGYTIDITERKQAEEKLRASEERFRQLIVSAPDAVFLVDQKGNIKFANTEAANLLGYAPEEFIGMEVETLMPQRSREGHIADRARYMDEPHTRLMSSPFNLIAVHKDGREISVDIKLSPFKMEAETYVVAFMHDITERKQAENELRETNATLQTHFNEINKLKEILQEQAIRDQLTGLHNRRYLDETLGHEVARARRENYPISMMLIDIDRFKTFNDAYGHSAGDAVLKSLSRLLVESVRQGDIACRYGGEEFLVVLIGAHETDVERRAEAICRDFSKLRINFEGQELSATVSVGIAFYPRHGMDIQQVISSADAAMYQAKEAGRNQVQVWQA